MVLFIHFLQSKVNITSIGKHPGVNINASGPVLDVQVNVINCNYTGKMCSVGLYIYVHNKLLLNCNVFLYLFIPCDK